MNNTDLSRRDFHRLTMAAFGGMVAGTLAGCSGKEEPAKKGTAGGAKDQGGGKKTDGQKTEGGPADTGKKDGSTEQISLLLQEPHVCRGLNTCKNTGASKDNACAGQGTCATATHHECAGQNDCKGQGGCGEKPGQNACKGMGECSVPLSDDAWKKARAAFEAAMKEHGRTFGQAPPKS